MVTDFDSSQVDYLRRRAKEQAEEADEIERKARMEKVAENIRKVYEAFVEVGFSDEQAWWFVTDIVKRSWGS